MPASRLIGKLPRRRGRQSKLPQTPFFRHVVMQADSTAMGLLPGCRQLGELRRLLIRCFLILPRENKLEVANPRRLVEFHLTCSAAWNRETGRSVTIPSLGLHWTENSRCLLQFESGRILV